MIYGGLVIHQQYAIIETNNGINNTTIVRSGYCEFIQRQFALGGEYRLNFEISLFCNTFNFYKLQFGNHSLEKGGV